MDNQKTTRQEVKKSCKVCQAKDFSLYSYRGEILCAYCLVSALFESGLISGAVGFIDNYTLQDAKAKRKKRKGCKVCQAKDHSLYSYDGQILCIYCLVTVFW